MLKKKKTNSKTIVLNTQHKTQQIKDWATRNCFVYMDKDNKMPRTNTK